MLQNVSAVLIRDGQERSVGEMWEHKKAKIPFVAREQRGEVVELPALLRAGDELGRGEQQKNEHQRSCEEIPW